MKRIARASIGLSLALAGLAWFGDFAVRAEPPVTPQPASVAPGVHPAASVAPGVHPAASVAPAPRIAELRAEFERVAPAARAAHVPEGALLSIAYAIDVAERIAGKFPTQAQEWQRRAAGYLALAAKGQDPLLAQHGKLVMRGYRSPVSELLQGYGIYVPANYDPHKRYPLLIMLHGGSANGNLFLGVVLGNNMNWKEYSIHLWDEYEARIAPDWIVVAPDGFGQIMWRFMGERDVLDVIADVQQHYSVDADRIALGGLSNGGVGAYNLGMRFASRFSVVQAIAGAPSWLQYTGGEIPPAQRLAMEPMSGMQLIENAINTDFRYYHGHLDGGPMKPRFIEELGKLIRTLGVPFKETWFDAGHDLLYLVHRHGRIYDDLAPLRRKAHPSEVRLVTGDYRAARQHWVEVTRIEHYPELARVRAVAEADRIVVETRNTLELALDLREAPLTGAQLTLNVDGKVVYTGARAALPDVLRVSRDASGWHQGALVDAPHTLVKKAGSSGPITDAYYDSMVHVYGTGDPAVTEALKKSAQRGAQGWPVWLWRVQQPVIADTEVTDALMHKSHLVLYGTPGSNSVLERIASQLPVRIDAAGVTIGARSFDGKGVGVKYVYPNPLAPERYVLVQAAPTVAGVDGGHNLPDFLPDYVVYDARTTASRPRLVSDRGHAPRLMGYFDRNWQLAENLEAGDDSKVGALATEARDAPPAAGAAVSVAPAAIGATSVAAEPHKSGEAHKQGPVPPTGALPAPEPPTEFAASNSTQAGQAARHIAHAITTFTNYRSKIRGASWVSDPAALWSIRDNDACLADLRDKQIPFKEVAPTLPALHTPVPAPVEITGPIEGVAFRMMHADRTLLMSCELAARLPDIARVVKAHGVERVAVISTYRDKPYSSFHTFGLALDISQLFTADGVLSVLSNFTLTPNVETCKAPPPSDPRARTLLEIACEIGATKRFSSVLTPNYNVGHRNHFHLDIRPDDPRVFVR